VWDRLLDNHADEDLLVVESREKNVGPPGIFVLCCRSWRNISLQTRARQVYTRYSTTFSVLRHECISCLFDYLFGLHTRSSSGSTVLSCRPAAMKQRD